MRQIKTIASSQSSDGFLGSPFNLEIAVRSDQFRLDKVVFAGH